MTTLPKTLKPFYNHIFSSGIVTGDDFKSFAAKYKNAVKKLLPEGYSIHSWSNGHYCLSAVIQDDLGRFIYLAIPDVRASRNAWADHILIRTMKHEKDWTGGFNDYTDLSNLSEKLKRLYS